MDVYTCDELVAMARVIDPDLTLVSNTVGATHQSLPKFSTTLEVIVSRKLIGQGHNPPQHLSCEWRWDAVREHAYDLVGDHKREVIPHPPHIGEQLPNQDADGTRACTQRQSNPHEYVQEHVPGAAHSLAHACKLEAQRNCEWNRGGRGERIREHVEERGPRAGYHQAEDEGR